jgi:hypothetical protein
MQSDVSSSNWSLGEVSVAISTAYDELALPGPASAARVRELATKAAEKGCHITSSIVFSA